MGRLILITGGARSGKSDFAQATALRKGGDDVLFLATAEALDDEMARRIATHQKSRPLGWRTVEAPKNAGRTIREQIGKSRVVVVDCLTLLVGNALLSLGNEPDAGVAEETVSREIAELLEAVQTIAADFIFVSGEVGMGLVPTNALGRLFRDCLGRANQSVASRADSVVLMVAGIPVDLKALMAPEL